MTATSQMDSAETPSCPTCGRTVFNKRYPKCEFCGASLPEGLVLSREERERVLEQDRIESDATWQERQKQEKVEVNKRRPGDESIYIDCGGHGG